jgi:Four helix bundle sensory module for signal transduction
MTSTIGATQQLVQKYKTPQILRGGWYATWGMSLLLLMISIYGVNSQRNALKTVGKDAAPSILTAQQLQDSFADMDASLANELLLKPGENQQVLADFDKNRKKIADRLVAAAKNITYPAEEKIIQSLQFNNSAYLLKLQSAREAHKRGDAVGALNVYRGAADIIDREIIPQAEKLSNVNFGELETTYARQKFANGGLSFLIAVIGLVQIAILVIIQLFLYQRMRRILNLPLLGATAIAIIFLGHTISSFMGATNNLKIAKEDAFNSLHSLRQMRSLSYKANGDESRYLLDRQNATSHEQSFKAKINKIQTIPPNLTNENIIGDVRQNKSVVGLSGLMADELNNITFTGEKELAIETFRSFNDYLKVDTQIRQLANSGKLAEAIALCIGVKQGESNWAFDRYKNIHTQLMDLNKKEFDQNIEQGNDRLANFEIIASVALGSVALLTLFGLRPRLAEYL